MTSADEYCGDFIRDSSAAKECEAVPDIDLTSGACTRARHDLFD